MAQFKRKQSKKNIALSRPQRGGGGPPGIPLASPPRVRWDVALGTYVQLLTELHLLCQYSCVFLLPAVNDAYSSLVWHPRARKKC